MYIYIYIYVERWRERWNESRKEIVRVHAIESERGRVRERKREREKRKEKRPIDVGTESEEGRQIRHIAVDRRIPKKACSL